MPIETALALMGFAFVMSVSPGPGNFLLLASGANFGLRRSLPLIFGISLGFLAMVIMVGLGFGQILRSTPELGHVIRIACAIYVIWLAVKLARSRSLGPDAKQHLGQPFSFVQAALMQLLNPKAWTVAILVTAAYVDPARPAVSLATLVAVFALINIPSISLWCISGTALRTVLAQGNRIAVFNIAMALLLLGSMAPVIFASPG